MSYRKISLIIFLLIVGYIWQSMNSLKSQKKKSLASKLSDSAVMQRTAKSDFSQEHDKKAPRGPGNKGLQEKDCIGHLLDRYQTDKCDHSCMQTFLKDRDPDLSYFLEERWDNPDLPNRKAYSRLGSLYNALSTSGSEIFPGKLANPDFERSHALLAQMAEDDPHNAFPLMFYALSMQKAGRMEEARLILEKAAQKNHYESYFADFNLRMQRATVDDPQKYMKGMHIYSALPFPGLKELGTLKELNPEAFVALMKLITDQAIKYGGKSMELKWTPLEHQFAIRFIREAAPGEADRIPNYKEILEKEKSSPESVWTLEQQGCHSDDYVKELQEHKEYLITL